MGKTKIFIAYSRDDKVYLNRLKKDLVLLERKNEIEVWYDGLIDAGTRWNEEIKNNLQSADLIILLVSANSLASDYFWNEEMKEALVRHERKEATVVPVILRHCPWEETALHKLQALPKDGKPITAWSDESAAYYNVFQGINKNVKKIQKQKKQATPYAQATRTQPTTSTVKTEIPTKTKPLSQNKNNNNFGKILKIALPILIGIAAIVWIANRINTPTNNDVTDTTPNAIITEATTEPLQTQPKTVDDAAKKKAAKEAAAKKERERLAEIKRQEDEKREQERLAEEQKQKRNNYNRLINKAKDKYDSGDYIGAKVLYKEAHDYSPDGAEANNGITACDDALQQLKAQQEKQNNYTRLINKAKNKYDSGDYSAAKALYQEARNYISDGSEALSGIKQCDQVLNPPPPPAPSYPQAIQDLIKNMVRVQGGDFTMGQPDPNIGGEGWTKDEQPPHTVTRSSFNIGKYEVTQVQWQAVMGSNPSHFKDCGSQCPVENVSWNDVQEFIKKLNQMTGKTFRLPTEAEWEYAARGRRTKGYKYAGSDDVGSVAWYDANSDSNTHTVGTKNPNELGLYDMSGNVWEWCSDWYDENYYKNSPRNNPQGSNTSQTFRVLRGGSWTFNTNNCRVAYRSRSLPHKSNYDVGFRLAQTP